VRGTVVHAALEALFDLPMPERTAVAAAELIDGAWERIVADDPAVCELFDSDEASMPLAEWLDSARALIGNYFRLESPAAFNPAERELLVETEIDGLVLRGFVDRLDVAPDGALRVVDYKTGATPREAFEAKALFQMKFYALVLWRTRGVVPAQLKLIYLADVDTLTYTPSEAELDRFEGTLKAIWAAIARAALTGDFRPNPSKLCNWCDHKALCPSFGGTPPPYPSGISPSGVSTGLQVGPDKTA
jgi:putative RecB family exonuclease